MNYSAEWVEIFTLRSCLPEKQLSGRRIFWMVVGYFSMSQQAIARWHLGASAPSAKKRRLAGAAS
jgi:hypothetical protein